MRALLDGLTCDRHLLVLRPERTMEANQSHSLVGDAVAIQAGLCTENTERQQKRFTLGGLF